MKNKWYRYLIQFQILFVLLVIIDQVTKLLAVYFLKDQTINILGTWCQLELTYNDGVAFSMLKNWPKWSLALISLVATGVIEWYLIVKKPKDKILTILLLILAAGAFGNCIDRWLMVFHVYKGVIDFVSVDKFAIFNIADCYVTLSCIAILIYAFFGKDDTEPSFKELKEAEKKLDENPDILQNDEVEETSLQEADNNGNEL